MARCRYMWFSCTSVPLRAFVPELGDGMLCRSKTLRCKGDPSRSVQITACSSVRIIPTRAKRLRSSHGNYAAELIGNAVGDKSKTVTSRFCRLLPGSRMSRSPTNSGAGECFSSVTRRTRCPRSRPAEPTPRSRVRTTWRGSSPRSYTAPQNRRCSTPSTPNGIRWEGSTLGNR